MKEKTKQKIINNLFKENDNLSPSLIYNYLKPIVQDRKYNFAESNFYNSKQFTTYHFYKPISQTLFSNKLKINGK
mgnify:CR=1 FL=1|jgi:hypothetical protein